MYKFIAHEIFIIETINLSYFKWIFVIKRDDQIKRYCFIFYPLENYIRIFVLLLNFAIGTLLKSP
jgi:hypothetical protein